MRADELHPADRVLVRIGHRDRPARVLEVRRERVTGGSRNVVVVELATGARLLLTPRRIVRVIRGVRHRRFDARTASRGLERLGTD